MSEEFDEIEEVPHKNTPASLAHDVLVVKEEGNSPEDVDGKNIFYTPTSALFTPDCTFDQWKFQGAKMRKVVQTIERHIQWWIGDWILHGQHQWPDIYSQALSKWMMEYGTARNCVYVCRNVPKEARLSTLSFAHHYAVARFPLEVQKEWLAKADLEGWTVSEFRRAIEGEEARLPKPEPKPKPVKPPEPEPDPMLVLKYETYEDFERDNAYLFPQKSVMEMAKLAFNQSREKIWKRPTS